MALPWRGSLGAARLLAVLAVIAILVPVSSVSAAPDVSTSATAQPATVAPGSRVDIGLQVSNGSSDAGSVLIYAQVRNPSGSTVKTGYWYRYLSARGATSVTLPYDVGSQAASGQYSVSVLVWGSGVYHRNENAGSFTVTGSGGSSTPTPSPTATATAIPPTPTPTATATATQPAPTPTATTPSGGSSVDAMETQFLSLLNDYRQQDGLAPLQRNGNLDQAAYDHSADMAERGYFSHTTPEGVSPWTRMREAGYTCQASMGENIAAGYSSAQAVFDAWRNSPGHNANMLSSNFDEIGIGLHYDPDSQYRYYWTTDFGRCAS